MTAADYEVYAAVRGGWVPAQIVLPEEPVEPEPTPPQKVLNLRVVQVLEGSVAS